MGSFSSESRPRGANAENGRSRLAAVIYTHTNSAMANKEKTLAQKASQTLHQEGINRPACVCVCESCVIYLCARFIHKRSDFPRERIERLHGVRWGNVPLPFVPPAISAMQQAAIVGAGSRDRKFHQTHTSQRRPGEVLLKRLNQGPEGRKSSFILNDVSSGENYLLPGVLGACSTVRWASAP